MTSTTNQPPALLPGYKQNFATLLKAARDGNLCLMSCLDTATQEPRAVICAVNVEPDGTHEMVPIAVMAWDNPYNLFTPPL